MKQIFINLPVKDVTASMHFYTEIGFTVNPLFTFDDQKCMVWSEQVYVMLQKIEMFQSGNSKELPEAKQFAIATFTLPVDSVDQMNEMADKAIKAGATETTPAIDEGFMQVRNIEDLDGHNWAIIYLDMTRFKAMKAK